MNASMQLAWSSKLMGGQLTRVQQRQKAAKPDEGAWELNSEKEDKPLPRVLGSGRRAGPSRSA